MDQLINYIPVSIFVASILGSTHCAGMCGPLYWSIQYKKLSVFFYHLGRVLSYMILGAIFGYFGYTISKYLPLKLIQIASGVVIILYISGSITQSLLNWNWLMIWQNKFSAALGLIVPKTIFDSIMRFSAFLPNYLKSFLIGSASAFLPCSWLYTFLIGVISTGSPLNGIITMLAFGLGTIPALILSTYFFKSNRYGKYINIVSMLAMIFFIYMRFPDLSLTTVKMSCH